jgi:hypothetical protein
LRRNLSILACSVTLAGCVSGFDRNDQVVNSLRILGVSQHVDGTDVADADIGDLLDLSALVSNPGGLGNVTVTWVVCLTPPDQPQPCTDPSYLVDPRNVVKMADDPASGVVKLGTGTDIQVTVPAALQSVRDALITRADNMPNAQCALYNNQIPLLVVAEDPTSNAVFAAVKNLRLSPVHGIGANSPDPALRFYVVNTLPIVKAFNLGPSSLSGCDGMPLATPCEQDMDCPGASCVNGACSGGATMTFPDGPQTICLGLDNPQSYYICTLDGPDLMNPVPEEPEVTWYMTGGALSGFVAPNNGSMTSLASRTFTVFTRPPGPFTIFGVVRDGRDGETWIAQDFQ